MAYLRNGRYWYRSVREGGRVRSVYVGTDEGARFAALCDNERQQEGQRQRLELQALIAQEGSGDKAVDAIIAQLNAVQSAALTASGYHNHSGTWRKKRQ